MNQYEADLKKERDAKKALKRFLENNADSLALLWRWGDGDGGDVFRTMKQHLIDTGRIRDDGKFR